MPLIFGVDFESTGTDVTKDRITEVGGCLFDWDSATPLVLQSDLVHIDVPIPQEVVELTGITDQMLEDYGKQPEDVFSDFHYLAGKADYLMAHFANQFDKPLYEATMQRLGIEPVDKLWLDSSVDCTYEKRITTRNLQYLAAEAGFTNPFRHRAVFDVLTMLRVASDFRLDAIVKRAQEPTLYVQAIVSFEEKEKAKERGYRWYGPTKTWWKSAKLSDYQAEKDVCGFKTVLLEKAPE